MPCHFLPLPGGVAIVCTRGRASRAKPCRVCGARSTRLCDEPLRGAKAGKTCDAPLCERCAVHVGPDRDLCPAHARLRQAAASRPALGLDPSLARTEG